MKAYKFVVLGDFGVGKTSLIRRYVLDEFSDDYRATLGVHLYKHSDVLEDGTQLALVVWDIEGAPMPSTQTKRYIIGASGAIIVGDLTRSDPFTAMRNAAELFTEQLPGRPMAFAFNKSDLAGERDQTDLAELADSYGAQWLLTSAKVGDRVNETFRTLGALVMARSL